MGTAHAPSARHSPDSAADRRREARHLVGGDVVLVFENPEPIEIRGRLVDLSASGFRAAHDCIALCPGQLVSFRHVWSVGKARVMWNRVVGEKKVESGLFVLQV